MRPIRLLSAEVASQIAAGEVIERPAAVVKELVENSIDASASHVTVEIKAGGVDQVLVIDDGAGIPAAEVALAFQRHATSKLVSQEDLDHVGTLGFRGEALPSIAAVSRTTIASRPPLETAGYRHTVSWGEVVESRSDGCPSGTRIEVNDLFGNQPARRKFLRAASTETARVQELVSRYALAFPNIRFQMVNEGRISFTTPGNGRPREALLAVYGPQAASNMLEVYGEDPESGYAVDGFAGSPDLSRANRSFMTFFVNRRWIQSRMLSFAVEEAYLGLLQVKRYPVVALNVTLPYGDVDVNSHPSKREVRFHQENRVFSTVQRAVRSVLVADSPVPRLAPPGPQSQPSRMAGGPSFFPRNPFGGGGPSSPNGSNPGSGYFAPPDAAVPRQSAPPLRVVGQLKLTYIVAEDSGGMYLVDQHAAHERVLFDRLLQRSQEKQTEAQALLAPVNLELTPSQAEVLDTNKEAVAAYGFDIEPFGDRNYLLRSVPAILAGKGPGEALVDVLDQTAFEGMLRQKEDVVLASIACHGAVRAGRPLTEEEMSSLLEQLESTPNPHTCPHGRPTMVHFSSNHVEREFGRR